MIYVVIFLVGGMIGFHWHSFEILPSYDFERYAHHYEIDDRGYLPVRFIGFAEKLQVQYSSVVRILPFRF